MFIYEKGMEQNLSNILCLHHIMFDMLHFIKYIMLNKKELNWIKIKCPTNIHFQGLIYV